MLTCAASSPFIYNPAGYIITGDLDIINNTCLRKSVCQRMENHEHNSIYWKQNYYGFRRGYYAKQWTNREKEDVDALFKSVKSVS